MLAIKFIKLEWQLSSTEINSIKWWNTHFWKAICIFASTQKHYSTAVSISCRVCYQSTN